MAKTFKTEVFHVREKLPKVHAEVWVYVIYEDGTATWTDSCLDTDGSFAMGSAKGFRVTHWMKIPPKPNRMKKIA